MDDKDEGASRSDSRETSAGTKALKVLAGVAVVGAVLYGFGRFFVAQLRTGPAPTGPPAVVFTPPPDYVVVERGDLDRPAAARALADLLAARPEEAKLGIHFTEATGGSGSEIYWLADRADPAAPVLVERAAGASGVRIETTWLGDLDARLAWAGDHGTFDAPGLPPGTRKNLYH